MLVHPDFDPVAISIGPIAIKWYGLMYLVAFALAYWLGRVLIAKGRSGRVTAEILDDTLFFGVLGVILGGRLGYVLFYKPAHYLANPLEIVQVWAGGMSFHGGFIGVLVAMWFVARKHELRWFEIADFVAPIVPTGLAAGRLGNFLNGELYGRVTDVPWGMVFRSFGAGNQPRHPSQLYQFALEGLLLFVILWLFVRKPRPLAAASGLFLVGYGVLRFIAEFFREPDDFLGLLAFRMSMGQWLSLPMILIGAAMMAWAYRRAARAA